MGISNWGDPNWNNPGLEARELPIKFGFYAFPWVMELKRTDVFRAML
jgi:hypothetical protein